MITQKFKKGDIIVQNVSNCCELFAVYGGIVYKNSVKTKKSKKLEVDYSLALYYSEGEVFEVDLKTGTDCGYVIGENQLYAWRKANECEVKEILKFLYKNSFAYDIEEKKVRKLKDGEQLFFKEEKKEIEDTSDLLIPPEVVQKLPIKIGSDNVKQFCLDIVKKEESKNKKTTKTSTKSSKKPNEIKIVNFTTNTTHTRNNSLNVYDPLGVDIW